MKTLALYIASVKLYARMGISVFGCAVFLLGLLAPWTSALADAPQTMYMVRGNNTFSFPETWYTSGLSACQAVGPAWQSGTSGLTASYGSPYTYASGSGYCYAKSKTGTGSIDIVKVTVATRCSDGGLPDTTKPLSDQCAAAVSNTCGGYETPELFAENAFSPLASPTCTWLDEQHINVSCSGVSKINGKQTAWETSCRPGGNNTPGKIVPDPVPTPEPPVEVDYPDCAAGSYSYTDIDGSTSCTTPEPEEDDSKSCTSGNAGTVNGRWVCLPSNPAPATASANESIAKAQADAAKAAPGTQTAADAAKAAAIAAQKAKDAANSLPTDQATQDAAQRAIDAAKQAAGHAGVPYTGPRSVGSGTGTGGGTGGGGTGTGGNNITVNVETCGIPGKPKCQIDESGTPDGKDAFKSAGDALTGAYEDATSQFSEITKADDKDTSFGEGATGWFTPGACESLNLGDMNGIPLVVNFCDQVSAASNVTSFIWVVSTFFGILWLVFNTMRGS